MSMDITLYILTCSKCISEEEIIVPFFCRCHKLCNAKTEHFYTRRSSNDPFKYYTCSPIFISKKYWS